MTEFEQRIYNSHLAVSRSMRNKPFKLKGNWKGFEENPNYLFVKRIANFFNRYPQVDMQVYFEAPYKLYSDVDYFDLKYFSSPRAIKSYTIYKQELAKSSPDEQIEEVKKSLHFIAKFCVENRILLDKYIHHSSTGLHPDWAQHVKEGKINFYSLMEFTNLYDTINTLSTEEQLLFLSPFSENFLNYKTKYINSKDLRPFLKLAFQRVRFFVEENLK